MSNNLLNEWKGQPQVLLFPSHMFKIKLKFSSFHKIPLQWLNKYHESNNISGRKYRVLLYVVISVQWIYKCVIRTNQNRTRNNRNVINPQYISAKNKLNFLIPHHMNAINNKKCYYYTSFHCNDQTNLT